MIFTKEEIAEILAGLPETATAIDKAAIIASIGKAIDLDKITADLFRGSAFPEQTAAARAAVTRQARQIAGNLTKSELTKIANKVAQAIEEGKSFSEFASSLTEVTGLDSRRAATLEKFKQALADKGVSGKNLDNQVERKRKALLKDRRETIAQTEQRMAMEQGKQEAAKSLGKKFKRSISAGDGRVSDICETNQAQGWIGIDENFDSGDQHPTYHPDCRCSLAYRTEPPNKFNEEVVQEDVSKTAEAKKEGS